MYLILDDECVKAKKKPCCPRTLSKKGKPLTLGVNSSEMKISDTLSLILAWKSWQWYDEGMTTSQTVRSLYFYVVLQLYLIFEERLSGTFTVCRGFCSPPWGGNIIGDLIFPSVTSLYIVNFVLLFKYLLLNTIFFSITSVMLLCTEFKLFLFYSCCKCFCQWNSLFSHLQ